MPKVLRHEYENELNFSLDYLVEKAEYETWKGRLMEQLRKSFKFSGFRDGHVPMDVFLKNSDSEKVQATLFQETIQRYFPEAFEAAKETLAADKRAFLDTTATLDPSVTKENEDGSFQFQINFNLLPQIDVSGLKGLVLPKVTEKDLPQRLTLQEFIDRETKNLLENINQKRAELKENTFDSLEACFAEIEDLRKQFTDQAGFEAFLGNLYSQETEFLLNDAKQRKVIDVVLEKVPPFALPENRINAEITRIIQNIQGESERSGKTLQEVFSTSGIPNFKAKIVQNLVDLTDVVSTYVQNEFRLGWGILRYIYETEAVEKISNEQLEQATKEIQKDPARYNVAANLTQDEYSGIAFDRLMRSIAGNILFSWIKFSEDEEEVKLETKEEKKDKGDAKKPKESKEDSAEETDKEEETKPRDDAKGEKPEKGKEKSKGKK